MGISNKSTTDEIIEHLGDLLNDEAKKKFKENKINGEAFLELNKNDLSDLSVTEIGSIKIILSRITKYNSQENIFHENTVNKEDNTFDENTVKKEDNTFYHQTNFESSIEILFSQIMKIGKKGLAGSGIYFSKTPKETYNKSRFNGVILKAKVKLGKIKEIVNGDDSITNESLKREGYDSVKILRYNGDEFVVYDSSQVTNIECHCINII